MLDAKKKVGVINLGENLKYFVLGEYYDWSV